MANGGVQCWGGNEFGQLGDGLPTARRGAANYVSGLVNGASAIGVGHAHSCAILAASGGVKCWGANSAGQLGNGALDGNHALPVDVVGLGAPATALAPGDLHTCAILTDKTVKCWGHQTSVGQGAASPQLIPFAIAGLTGVARISAGPLHTCAALESGAAKCWGSNNSGQLGSGSMTNSPVAVDVTGLSSGVAMISAGGAAPSVDPTGMGASHTCATMTAGGLKCWGSNVDGQLGDGSLTNRPLPVDVSSLSSGVSQLSLGGANNGQQGTLPTSSDTQFTTPRDVPGFESGISAVAAGGISTCVLLSADGAVHCMGGAPPGAFVTADPVAVMTGPDPQAIARVGALLPMPIGSQRAVTFRAGQSGNPLTLTSLTPSICAVSSPADPVFDVLFQALVSGLAQGKCRFTANQAGNSYYDPAELTIEVLVGDPLQQTITFDATSPLPVDSVGTLQATASSGLPVVFFTSTNTRCSVSGNTVIGLAVGDCSITARQHGDSFYSSAHAEATIPIVANPTGPFGLVVAKLGSGAGTITSSPGGIACGDTCVANFPSASNVTLSAAPLGGSVLVGWGGACSGRGICDVTMDALKGVTALFLTPSQARLGNISTLAHALAGEDTMIGGFVIGGTANKTVAIVATGSSLAQFGIANPLANPTLTLVRASDQAVVATNDDWQQAVNQAELVAAGLDPPDSREAAILVNLAPGAYTAIVGGAAGATGVSVIGVYEVDQPTVPLLNISTRGRVGTGGDVLIGGFVIQGSGPQTVAIVATGPSLAQHGIANPLANPKITLTRSSDQAVIAANDDWETDPEKASLQVVGLAPPLALESGLLRTLSPGAYTVIVEGVGGTTGVAVIGIYKVN